VHVVGRTPRRNYDVLSGYIMGKYGTCRGEAGESGDSFEDMKSLLQAWPVHHYFFIEPHFSSSVSAVAARNSYRLCLEVTSCRQTYLGY
jgi:hypothetical protein